MKKILLPLLTFLTFNVFAQSPFITTWETASANETITIPTDVSRYTYDYTVDWGDGTVDSGLTGNASHVYPDAGVHTISISGQFPSFSYSRDKEDQLLSIEQWGDIEWRTMINAFSSCDRLTYNATDAPDLSRAVSLYGMFSSARFFNADLSNWDVSNISNFNFTFYGARSFNGDISNWDMSSARGTISMFGYADAFNQDISGWDVSSVTNMSGMFESADAFNQDISGWDVSKVTSMSSMFKYAGSFNYDISSWDVSAVTNMSDMFYQFASFNQDISAWNVGAATDMSNMFYGTSFNQNINGWDVSSVQNMKGMFQGNNAFNQNLDSWDVSAVTNMSAMFKGAIAFNQDLSTWDVSAVQKMYEMFSDANDFAADISSWDVSNVNDMSSMFFRSYSFNSDLSNWDVSAVLDMNSMFYYATSFNQDITSWDVAKVRDFSFMFNNSRNFNQEIGSWDVGLATSMKSMFYNADAFNGDINAWNVSNVKNFELMFYGTDEFNQNLSDWDVSSATNLSRMFKSSLTFNGDISGWDVSNVQTFSGMFDSAPNFNQDLSAWKITSATNLSYMFDGASSFNSNVGLWEVGNVTSMTNMFNTAKSFNQNLGDWDIRSAGNIGSQFLYLTNLSVENFDSTLQGWASLENLQRSIVTNFTDLNYCNGETARNQLINDFDWDITGDSKNCSNITPSDIQLSNYRIAEGNAVDAVIGALSTVDRNGSDAHAYSLVAGSGDSDNNSFSIAGDQLIVNYVLDFNVKPTYSVRVQTDDGNGGLFSKEFTIEVVKESVLDFPALTSKTFGDADFELVATSNSTEDINFSSSDNSIVSVSGSQVRIISGGEVTITASQKAGTEFMAAEVSRQLVVARAEQTITQSLPSSITYGDSLIIAASNNTFLPISFTSLDENIISVYEPSIKEETDLTITLNPGFDPELINWTITNNGEVVAENIPLGSSDYSQVTRDLSLPDGNYSFFISGVNRSVITVKKGTEILLDEGYIYSPTGVDFTISTETGQKIAAVGLGTVDVEINSAGSQNYLPAQIVHPITINKIPQTIEFAALADKTYGDSEFELTATSNSELPVIFSSSDENVVSIEGSTVTIHNAGTASITAQQAGNENYIAATDVVRTLTVNKANQNINFPSVPRKTYGNDPFALGITTTSGLEVTYSISDESVVEIEGDTATILGAGYANIVASQAGNANYNPVSTRNRVLIVNKASQSISFGSLANRIYGDSDFNFEASATSGLNVTFSSSDESVVSITGNTATIVGAGTALITASQGGNANYANATNRQYLTIERAVQVIDFETLADKSFGNPAFEAVASTSADLPVYFTTNRPNIISIDGTTLSIVGTGTVDIVARANGNSNYQRAESVSQTLVIGKGEQIVNFAQPQDRTFGDENFQFNYSINSGNEVLFSSSDQSVVSINGSNDVSINGAGTVEITAIAIGDQHYFTSTPVIRTLTVNKAAQTISFQNISDAVYGDGDINLFAEASNVNNEVQYTSSNSDVATITFGRIVIMGAGTSEITAAIAGNDDYNDISSTQSFTVNPASLTITADNQVIDYGDMIPNLSYSVSGFAYNETEDDLAEDIVLSTAADATSSVGEYSIDVVSGVGPNYVADRINGILTINKASQAISLEAIGEQYLSEGSVAIEADVTSGLPLSYVVQGPATVSNNLLSFTGAGTVSLTAIQEGDNNYLPAEAQQVSFEIIDDTQEEQTITIEPIDDQFSTVVSVEVIASASSGLSLSYALISGPASLNGNTVNLSGELGAVTIEVSQAGNSDYLPASSSVSFEVIPDPCQGFEASISVLQNVSCNAGGDGSFEVNLTNGTAPFTYSIGSESQEDNLFEELPAGNYDVTITDTNGCTATASVEITEPEELAITFAESSDSNSIDGNGRISLTVEGGSGDYSYDWSTGSTQASISGLSIGEYTVIITDEAGCSITETYSIGGVTSNRKEAGREFKIYPNPANDKVNVLHSPSVEVIKLYDAYGRIVAEQLPKSETTVFDMKALSSGLYFIQMDNGELSRIIKR